MSSPALSLRGVQLHPASAPIDLTVDPGTSLAILGGNGTGKSRLLAALLGQFDSDGTIDIFGVPVHRSATRRRALAEVGVLFQENGLIRDLTVRENVTLPGLVRGRLRNAENQADADTLLALLGATHLADTYPSELSAGEARRVALARAIAGDSRLLLVDEPTAGLSEDARDYVIALLRVLLSEGVIEALIVFTEDHHLAHALASRTLILTRQKETFGHSQLEPATP